MLGRNVTPVSDARQGKGADAVTAWIVENSGSAASDAAFVQYLTSHLVQAELGDAKVSVCGAADASMGTLSSPLKS